MVLATFSATAQLPLTYRMVKYLKFKTLQLPMKRLKGMGWVDRDPEVAVNLSKELDTPIANLRITYM